MNSEELIISPDTSISEVLPNSEPKKDIIYDKCITCPDVGKTCNGPNMLILPILDVREMVRRRRMAVGLTIDKLADRSGIPKTTVERFLRGTAVTDFKYTTVSAIVRAVISFGNPDGVIGDNPCTAATHEIKETQQEFDAIVQQKDSEIAELAEKLANIKGEHNRQLQEAAQDTRRRVEFLKQLSDDRKAEIADLKAESVRKNRIIITLSAVLLVIFCLLLMYVVADMMHSGFGFFKW